MKTTSKGRKKGRRRRSGFSADSSCPTGKIIVYPGADQRSQSLEQNGLPLPVGMYDVLIMIQSVAELEEVGLEVTDLTNEAVYASRRLHSRNGSMQMEGLHRIAVAFVQSPETILQELVNAAVRLCGADSAGVSIERDGRTAEHFYEWVATAGEYSSFLGASLPEYPSACTVCLERKAPQLFRVSKRFFDILGVEAAIVKDGILLPWEVEGTRGTIFIISHTREEAFDSEDLHLMQILANFAAMGIRQQRQQERLLNQARSAAAISMAHELAHEINNPLQCLTNTLFLAQQNDGVGDEKSLAAKLEPDFERLSGLAKRLLELPRKVSGGEEGGAKAPRNSDTEAPADTSADY